VYKNDGNFSSPNSSNTKKLSTVPGNGNLPSANIYCLAEDKDGDIWVGTDKGIAVFYSPDNILNGGDAQQIFVEEDNKTQILLETELISAIAVDGGNQKWIGTRSNGIYLFSSDGQKQIHHFTDDNSPLFSNSILDIEIDGKTGEVFIATEKGMVSFQNTIIEPFEKFEEVYCYPNPVKPDYSGPVLIHGMMDNAVVKIVDVAGNLVYETTANGGQAIWYTKNLKGSRVSSGVYAVLAATKDGAQKTVTKILVIN
jgi:ligand-binding sensor domain-containing protein